MVEVPPNEYTMDLKDCIKQLSEKVAKYKENLLTEEATKNTLIMPFISALGYDVFNPLEVIPEMDCDMVKKKGEKIDYAIMKDGMPVMLIECKHWQQNLDLHDNQLQRYYVASKAKFGVLTNGIVYRFYADLETPNIMDKVPFLEINLEDLKDSHIEELKKFHKSYFDAENILATASELKFTRELKRLIANEIESPSPTFVKHFAWQIYPKQIRESMLAQFTKLTKKAFQSYINDQISERLKSALKTEEDSETNVSSQNDVTNVPVSEPTSKINTTEEELESYMIVKAILRSIIDVSRVAHRDTQSYFGILLDDNNRKPICRMYLNSISVKYISVFDENGKEVKYKIQSLDEIYNYSAELIAVVNRYDTKR